MANIVMNGVDYGYGSAATMAYVSQRAVYDDEGNLINKIYLKMADAMDDSGLIEIDEALNAGFHNSLFRGKDITDRFESGDLYDKIADGTFQDLFIGDYFITTINSKQITCRLAGFDVYLHRGDTELTQHHAVIVPDEAILNASMNSGNTTADGFVSSAMYGTTLPSINTMLTEVFGSHLIEHRELLSKAMDSSKKNSMWFAQSGAASDWGWYSVKSCLMTEVEVFGSKCVSSSFFDVGTGMSQLPLFKLESKLINNKRFYWWLRAVVSSSCFVYVDYNGSAYIGNASSSIGVRPRWLIG